MLKVMYLLCYSLDILDEFIQCLMYDDEFSDLLASAFTLILLHSFHQRGQFIAWPILMQKLIQLHYCFVHYSLTWWDRCGLRENVIENTMTGSKSFFPHYNALILYANPRYKIKSVHLIWKLFLFHVVVVFFVALFKWFWHIEPWPCCSYPCY